jgi:hypothetical protein
MASESKRLRVYSIIERPDDSAFWLNVGMAYPHQDGLGFNVQLQALPLNGRLTLRAPGSQLAEHDGEQGQEQPAPN